MWHFQAQSHPNTSDTGSLILQHSAFLACSPPAATKPAYPRDLVFIELGGDDADQPDSHAGFVRELSQRNAGATTGGMLCRHARIRR